MKITTTPHRHAWFLICKRNYRKRREKQIQYYDPLLTPKWSVVFL